MGVSTCEFVSVTDPQVSEHKNGREKDRNLRQEIGGHEHGELDLAQDRDGNSRRDRSAPKVRRSSPRCTSTYLRRRFRQHEWGECLGRRARA
jgi:hypothetical protein